MLIKILRYFATWIGLHVHDWGNWLDSERLGTQVRYCSTCNKIEVNHDWC